MMLAKIALVYLIGMLVAYPVTMLLIAWIWRNDSDMDKPDHGGVIIVELLFSVFWFIVYGIVPAAYLISRVAEKIFHFFKRHAENE